MRDIVLVILIVCFCFRAAAQTDSSHADGYHTHHGHHHHIDDERMRKGTPPFSYIGFSTGINNPSGDIGFDFDIPVSRYISIGAGGGFSTWGNKLHFDAKYFLKRHQRGWAIGGGFTFNSGDNNYQTRYVETVAGSKEQVYLDLKTQRNLFLAIYHYWNLGKRYNRFFAELGWSEALADKKFIQLSGDKLTPQSADKIDRLSPGGLMVGIGFSFGLHH